MAKAKNFHFNAELLCKARLPQAEHTDMPVAWIYAQEKNEAERRNFIWGYGEYKTKRGGSLKTILP